MSPPSSIAYSTAITDASVGVKNPKTMPPTMMPGVRMGRMAWPQADKNSFIVTRAYTG